ncbi:hypothetical protein T4D_14588 [Trichinella pseudospiralis]|uniref:Uncharacterized protein n=1 Tax=Trichinella pseudospiralis TaxID=6337 RepID=A0A0V1G1N6_TRIPS|nr:hypothetical protein T4D_14588 [Trichinella pseudospiralis]
MKEIIEISVYSAKTLPSKDLLREFAVKNVRGGTFSMLAVDEVRKVYVLFFVSGAPIRATDTGASTDLAEFAVKNVCGDTFSMLAVDEQRKLCVLFFFSGVPIRATGTGVLPDVRKKRFQPLRAHYIRMEEQQL